MEQVLAYNPSGVKGEHILARYSNPDRDIAAVILYGDLYKWNLKTNKKERISAAKCQEIISEVVMRADTEPHNFTYVNTAYVHRIGLKC